jgi:hypothetical protein
MPNVEAGDLHAGRGQLARRVLETALFTHADSELETTAFGGDRPAGGLRLAVAEQVRTLMAGLTPDRDCGARGDIDVRGSAVEPGLVLVSVATGTGRAHLGVQVVDHGELLVRDRVESLPDRRDRFRAAAGRDAAWYALLAGDLTDHRVRQRVQSVQGRFAWDGDLVVAPQYAAGFLRLGAADLHRLVDRVTDSCPTAR